MVVGRGRFGLRGIMIRVWACLAWKAKVTFAFPEHAAANYLWYCSNGKIVQDFVTFSSSASRHLEDTPIHVLRLIATSTPSQQS